MPGEAVQVNCLAYATYKWIEIYWEKERIITYIYASYMCIKKKKKSHLLERWHIAQPKGKTPDKCYP